MERQIYKGKLTTLGPNEIFVFGANTERRNGAGAAKTAKILFGAGYRGPRGLNGRSYALVTKNLTPGYLEKETGITYTRYGKRSVSGPQITDNIRELYATAISNPELKFFVVYSGARDAYNLNGYRNRELASFFRVASATIPSNIVFEEEFDKLVFG